MKIPVSDISRPKLRGLRGMGATEELVAGDVFGPGYENDLGFNSVSDILIAINNARQQDQLYKLNIERVRQGLPPISSQTLAPTYNFGLSNDTQKLVIGAVVIVGLIALFKGIQK